VTIEGEPRQRIETAVKVPFTDVDLSREVDPEAVARDIVTREAGVPFDLARAPLLRVTIIRLAAHRFVVALTMHHIIGDGWSLNVLYNELVALYEAHRLGVPSSLPPLRIQYKDFSHWQNRADFGPAESFWLQTLKGATEAVSLPYDLRPAEESRDFQGNVARLILSQSITESLGELATSFGTTLSNVVLAAFAATLQAVSHQNDFCVGLSVANRNDPDVERLIGFFVNILPIRLRFDKGATYADIIRQVTENVYRALDHREYPFDLLVRKLNPGRQANRQPLLNVIYGFQNYRDVHLDADNALVRDSGIAEATDFKFSFRTSKFDLCLFVSEIGKSLVLELEYDTGLFLPATIEKMLALVERCGKEMSGHPQNTVALALDNHGSTGMPGRIGPANATSTGYPRDNTIHALFSECMRAAPDAIAIHYQGVSVTYEELDRRSSRVAHFLIGLGVEHQEFVAVLFDRSPDMIAALLGVLKAGAACVPLTSDMPYERLRGLLDDAGARVLLSEKRHLNVSHKLHWECSRVVHLLCLDSDDITREVELIGGIMDPEIWKHVADQAFDDISGGGWTSSYTGEWLSRAVMDEYGENIHSKLAPLLTPESRVLDIGCASGISMF
jgi:hypothetical protein